MVYNHYQSFLHSFQRLAKIIPCLTLYNPIQSNPSPIIFLSHSYPIQSCSHPNHIPSIIFTFPSYPQSHSIPFHSIPVQPHPYLLCIHSVTSHRHVHIPPILPAPRQGHTASINRPPLPPPLAPHPNPRGMHPTRRPTRMIHKIRPPRRRVPHLPSPG